jgi:hypothetical protein
MGRGTALDEKDEVVQTQRLDTRVHCLPPLNVLHGDADQVRALLGGYRYGGDGDVWAIARQRQQQEQYESMVSSLSTFGLFGGSSSGTSRTPYATTAVHAASSCGRFAGGGTVALLLGDQYRCVRDLKPPSWEITGSSQYSMTSAGGEGAQIAVISGSSSSGTARGTAGVWQLQKGGAWIDDATISAVCSAKG